MNINKISAVGTHITGLFCLTTVMVRNIFGFEPGLFTNIEMLLFGIAFILLAQLIYAEDRNEKQ